MHNWVERKLREIITPDMVSLWMPGGDGRVRDVIRGNHGQVIGANPNVNIRPTLISPDLGWSMDGVNDYVEIPHDSSITFTSEEFTVGGWVYIRDITANKLIYNKGEWNADGWYFEYKSANNTLVFTSCQSGTTQYQPSTGDFFSVDKWYFIIITRSGNTVKIFVQNVDKTAVHVNLNDPAISIRTLKIGCSNTLTNKLSGNMLLPFTAKSAWGEGQRSNMWYATKDIFSPLG